jgi:hypothetical protein
VVRLAAASAQHGGVYVSISADVTRVHMIDQVFFAVSRAIDWEGLAAAHVRAAYHDAAFPVPDGAALAVGEVARYHDVDSRELYRSVRRLLERGLLGNPMVTTEMGRAMLRLAQAQLGAGDIDTGERDAVLCWLHGELRSIAAQRTIPAYLGCGAAAGRRSRWPGRPH